MKYLFVHDHILNSYKKNYYSPGGLSNEVMKRYLFNDDDTITLYTRQRFCEKKDLNQSEFYKNMIKYIYE